jgi:hypothetical protein
LLKMAALVGGLFHRSSPELRRRVTMGLLVTASQSAGVFASQFCGERICYPIFKPPTRRRPQGPVAERAALGARTPGRDALGCLRKIPCKKVVPKTCRERRSARTRLSGSPVLWAGEPTVILRDQIPVPGVTKRTDA